MCKIQCKLSRHLNQSIADPKFLNNRVYTYYTGRCDACTDTEREQSAQTFWWPSFPRTLRRFFRGRVQNSIAGTMSFAGWMTKCATSSKCSPFTEENSVGNVLGLGMINNNDPSMFCVTYKVIQWTQSRPCQFYLIKFLTQHLHLTTRRRTQRTSTIT